MLARITRSTLVTVAVLAACLIAAPAGASAQVTHRPVLVSPHLGGVTYATSSNWAGWDDIGGTYWSVKASWVQPSVTCSSGETSYSSFWVGLDGDGSNSVEQTGTEADCYRGSAYYSSWYEFYPAYPVNYSDVVKPGDAMTSQVVYHTSTGHYLLTLSDTTRGWAHTKTGSAPDGTNASAEVIAEAPSSISGVLPLANFGTVTFTGATVNGHALGTVPTPQKITMVSGSTTKASVTALSGNNKFSVTWRHR